MTALDGPTDVDDTEGASDKHGERNLLLLKIVAVASVVPFFWAAIRDARDGYYPTLDVAATVLRSLDVFSKHPPMIGMWSSGSSWAGHEIHFPGATQLYLLAIPTQLFGSTWGPLLAMAMVNAAWVLLAGWLIHRRSGVNGALLGFAVLTAFSWAIGSENLIDPRPMEMVTVPFLCFLFAVWAVASEDIDVIPALAVVANYLFLNHLVLALQVPVIGACAAVGVWNWTRTKRSQTDQAGPDHRRRLRRRLLQGAGITLVMWLPSLIQEVRADPGNLTLLIRASGHDRDPVGSYTAGYNAMMKLITDPWFWFNGRLADPTFPDGLNAVDAKLIVGGVVLFAVFVFLAVVGWKRGDRSVVAAIMVATVAMLISVVTVVQAPAGWGFPTSYLRSLWGLAAFVWFVVAYGAYRCLRASFQHRVGMLAAGIAVVMVVLALPYADHGSAIDMADGYAARHFVDKAVPKLVDRGDVFVVSEPDFGSLSFYPALLLALKEKGVNYCVPNLTSQQYGSAHACWARSKVFVHVWVGSTPPPGSRGKVLVRQPLLQEADVADRTRVEAVVHGYVASHRSIRLTSKARQFLDSAGPAFQRAVRGVVAPDDGNLAPSLRSPLFKQMLDVQQLHASNPGSYPRVFADPNFPTTEMAEYLSWQSNTNYIWLTEDERQRTVK